MKSLLSALVCASCLLTLAFAANAQTDPAKPELLILGTYHMGNPGRDLGNIEADDVRAEKRQTELKELVETLKRFRPTKIAVELPPTRASYLDNYQAYRDGKFELRANEVDQIGFRLAKEMNHARVYTIDWPGNFDFEKVAASAQANGQAALAENFKAGAKREAARHTELLRTKTVGGMFDYLNDDRLMDEWHTRYMSLLRIGSKDEYAGADLVRDWYDRNLKIYANIVRLAEPRDRVLVIIGAGHTKLLRQFAVEAGDFELKRLAQLRAGKAK
jgi:hypothetical protein